MKHTTHKLLSILLALLLCLTSMTPVFAEEGHDHSWDSNTGKCTVEGCTATCSHSWSNGVCGTCQMHCDHSWYNGVCGTCDISCSHSWDNGICGTCGVSCSHSWDNGICGTCGAPCPHPEEYVGTWTDESDDYESIDNAEHERNTTISEYNYCYQCDTELDLIGITYEYHVEYHTYDANGVCKYCGHENTCEHTNTREDPIRDDFSNFTAIDDESHSFTCNIYTYTYCRNCEEPISSVLKETGVARSAYHSYEDGVCEDCGHVCTHSNIDSSMMAADELTYTSVDNVEHIASGMYITITHCADCDKIMSESDPESSSVTEYHCYGDDGVCEDCGHVCSHSNIDSNMMVEGEVTYTSIDDAKHTASGMYITETYCVDCYKILSESDPESSSVAEYHYYDDDGVCEDCGHVCTHSDTDSSMTAEGEITYTSVDDAMHTASGMYITETYCANCYKTISVSDPKSSSGKEYHCYGDDGVCEDCGHVCSHPYTASNKEPAGEITYTSVNDTNHTATGDFITVVYCYECGKVMSESDPESTTVTEKHSYGSERNGVCEDCGHACSHPSRTRYNRTHITDESCTSINDVSHKAVQQCYDDVVCGICFRSLSAGEPYEKTVTEEHRYNNGVCEDCGHVNECSHPEDQIITKRYVDTYMSTPINEYYHRNTGDLIETRTCNACGEELSETFIEEGVVSAESHYFTEDDNYCRTCGYEIECEHPAEKLYLSYWMDAEECTAVDGVYHQQTGTYYVDTICSVCKSCISTELVDDNYTRTKYHNFDDDNRCYSCDYEASCTHPADMLFIYEDSGAKSLYYEQVNDTQHRRYFANYHKVFCTECRTTLSYDLINTTSDLEPHTFVNGVCTYCGCVNTCDHSSGNRKTRTSSYSTTITSRNETTHTHTGSIIVETICTDCGEVVDYTIISDSTLIEAHDYLNGFCYYCYYKQPTSSSSSGSASKSSSAVAAPVRMAEKLLTATDTLLQKNQDKEIAIVLMYADEILTEGEMVTFNELTIDEQILVLLSAIGYEEEADYYLTEHELTLSGEAQALIASIADRITAMTDEEKDAHAAALEEFFPVETITVDGEECEFTVICLMITIDGDTCYNLYGFCPDAEADWYFYNLVTTDTIDE